MPRRGVRVFDFIHPSTLSIDLRLYLFLYLSIIYLFIKHLNSRVTSRSHNPLLSKHKSSQRSSRAPSTIVLSHKLYLVSRRPRRGGRRAVAGGRGRAARGAARARAYFIHMIARGCNTSTGFERYCPHDDIFTQGTHIMRGRTCQHSPPLR